MHYATHMFRQNIISYKFKRRIHTNMKTTLQQNVHYFLMGLHFRRPIYSQNTVFHEYFIL